MVLHVLERQGVSTHQQLSCLFSRIFRLTTKKISTLCITARLWGESTGWQKTVIREVSPCYDLFMLWPVHNFNVSIWLPGVGVLNTNLPCRWRLEWRASFHRDQGRWTRTQCSAHGRHFRPLSLETSSLVYHTHISMAQVSDFVGHMDHISMLNCNISSTLAMEILQYWTKPTIWLRTWHWYSIFSLEVYMAWSSIRKTITFTH